MRLLPALLLLTSTCPTQSFVPSAVRSNKCSLRGWVERGGEWEWEDDDNSTSASTVAVAAPSISEAKVAVQAAAKLPSGSFRPKQSLGQNFLQDGNTIAKIVKAFQSDVTNYETQQETSSSSTLLQDGADAASSEEFATVGDEEEDDLGEMTVVQLKELCKEYGLKVSGNKTELIDRLRDLDQDPSESDTSDESVAKQNIIELGPGAGALTDTLYEAFGSSNYQCIEIDPRSIEMLGERYPDLEVVHMDVLQMDYPAKAEEMGGPLYVIGNLPYYITSQILFALCDASHYDAVRTATVTMQWEVAQRIVANTCSKDYGILSVVFQLYAHPKLHFKIPPTVFYPAPKVDSALIGLEFIGSKQLENRLGGVKPLDLRRVVTTAFRQRRKTLRNGLKKLAVEAAGGDKERAKEMFNQVSEPPQSVLELRNNGDKFATTQQLSEGWASKRPEELSAGEFVEVTRILFGYKTEKVEILEEKYGESLSMVYNIANDSVTKNLKAIDRRS